MGAALKTLCLKRYQGPDFPVPPYLPHLSGLAPPPQGCHWSSAGMWLLSRERVPMLRAALPRAGFTVVSPRVRSSGSSSLRRLPGLSIWGSSLKPLFFLPGIYGLLYLPQLLRRMPSCLFERPPRRLPSESVTPRSLNLAPSSFACCGPAQTSLRLCCPGGPALPTQGGRSWVDAAWSLGRPGLELPLCCHIAGNVRVEVMGAQPPVSPPGKGKHSIE